MHVINDPEHTFVIKNVIFFILPITFPIKKIKTAQQVFIFNFKVNEIC